MRVAGPGPSTSEPLQHPHQLRQRAGIETAFHFDPPPTGQHHRYAAAARAHHRVARPGHLDGKPATSAGRLPLRCTPMPIPVERAQGQSIGTAELGGFQSAGFELRGDLFDLCTTAPPPHSCSLRLFVHPFSASLTGHRDQRGWSDAYVAVAGKQILEVLYRPEYAAHHSVLLILMVAALLSNAASVLGYAATAARQFRAQPAILLITIAVQFGACVLLIPGYKLRGAAAALVAGACAQLLGFLVIILRALISARSKAGEEAATTT